MAPRDRLARVSGNFYGSLIALAFFCALQLVGSRPVVYLILGLTPFISYVLPPKLKLNVDRPWHPFICGISCTGLQLLAGVAGPLLDVFFLQSQMTGTAWSPPRLPPRP